VRVIAGRFKGRRLKTPAWEGLRPTSDKLRETLFNIVAPRVEGAKVLDAFAGTGALGIEAVSRGAAHVTFIEADRRAAKLIAENLALCGVRDGYTIHRGDTVATLRAMPDDIRFDLILLDPPYDARGVVEALDASAAHLAPGGLVVLEGHALTRLRDVRSGDSTLTFFERRPDGAVRQIGNSV
jgi:16S rRNA (guanine966-N2)-methyltransferase